MTGPLVLGLCAYTHDSSARLIADGSLAGMAEEERLSGVKHTSAYPAHAVEWLLTEAGVTADGIGIIAYNFAGNRHLTALTATPSEPGHTPSGIAASGKLRRHPSPLPAAQANSEDHFS